MKPMMSALALMILSPFAFSDNSAAPPVLDKIAFQMSAKQWVNTQTALLAVSINVTLNNADLVKARSEVMDSLNKVAKGEWHLINFERSQDNSGLEKLFVQAQVRVDQTALTDIYQNAKSVSKPGAQYTISSVEFKPSLEEVQAVRTQIRHQLYQQVSDEVARMNKAYPLQNYSVSHLMFLDGQPAQPPVGYQAKTMNAMAMAEGAAPLAVSNELVLTAFVEAASNRQQGK